MNPFSISNLTQRSNAHILHNHLKGKKKNHCNNFISYFWEGEIIFGGQREKKWDH